jgi:spore coat protein A
VTPFQVRLPISPVATPVRRDATTDYYEITMRQADVEMIPGASTRIWGYDGITPGPTFRVQRGREVVVRQHNRLPEGTTAHLHGGHMESRFDGHPMDLIAQGSHKDYVYPNIQLPTTLWYHDHAMDVTGPHVYRGLAGVYIIEDEEEAELGLPSGAYDLPIVIQDRTFSADGSLVYTADHMGEMGDTLLANGVAYPFHEVETRKVRFRFLNASNARTYELALSNGQSFIQIGTDGGLLPAPVTRRSISLASAERADVVIDFSNVEVGTRIVLQNRLGSGRTAQVMRFDVTRRVADDSQVPAVLRQMEVLQAADAAVQRTFTFSQQMGMMGAWVINGLSYDPERIDARPRLGDTEIWTLINRSMMDHPVHIHDIQWQILDINGRQPSAADRGWKDTFMVPAMGTVRVIGRFTNFTGVYMLHCHILEHEDHAMMAQFEVVS